MSWSWSGSARPSSSTGSCGSGVRGRPSGASASSSSGPGSCRATGWGSAADGGLAAGLPVPGTAPVGWPAVGGWPPGTLVGDEVVCGDGRLELVEVRPEGRAPQSFAAWRRGARPRRASVSAIALPLDRRCRGAFRRAGRARGRPRSSPAGSLATVESWSKPPGARTQSAFPCCARDELKVAPSILAADFGRLADRDREGRRRDRLAARRRDGRPLRPEPHASGRPWWRRSGSTRRCFFDCHLMMTDPGEYLEAFREAGADSCSVHVEVGETEALVCRDAQPRPRRGARCEP